MTLQRLVKIAIICFFTQNSFSQEKGDYFIKNININTNKTNYGATFYGTSLLFYSTMNDKNNLDFYFGFVDDYGDVVDIKPVNKNVNGNLNEVDLVFTSDLKRVYFTRGSGKYGRHLELYTAKVESPESWTDIKRLPFNRQSRSIGYPALSADDKTLYFSSNRSGSIGGYDIFKVKILGKNKYSEAINLGPVVNTKEFETSPFISENILYYSSARAGGMGGYDIYYFDLKDKNAVPINLGNAINSDKDDYGFVIKKSDNIGYIASNREEGKGGKDIYSFQNFIRPSTPEVNEVVEISEKDDDSITVETVEPVNIQEVAPVVITKAEPIVIQEVEAVVLKTVEPVIQKEDVQVSVNSEKTIATKEITPIDVNTVEPVIEKNTPLWEAVQPVVVEEGTAVFVVKSPVVIEEEAPNVVETMQVVVVEVSPKVVETLQPIVVEEDVSVVEETVLPEVVEENTPVVVETVQPIVIEEDVPIVVETVQPIVVEEDVPVVVETVQSIPFVSTPVNQNASTVYAVELSENPSNENVSFEQVQYNACKANILRLNDIYFNFNKSSIRNDAAMELDKAIDIMRACPNFRFTANSFTDSKGHKSYNLQLSQRRANAAIQYILRNGNFSNDKVSGKGFGEQMLKNRCSDGVKCTRQEHQVNRRTEIEISNIYYY